MSGIRSASTSIQISIQVEGGTDCPISAGLSALLQMLQGLEPRFLGGRGREESLCAEFEYRADGICTRLCISHDSEGERGQNALAGLPAGNEDNHFGARAAARAA